MNYRKEFDRFLKLFTILYAVGTALLAESEEVLQSQLNSLSDYCSMWKQKVNTERSKIVVF